MTFKQRMAIEHKNKQKILAVCNVPNESGIYILTREEDGFKYAYIGQAKHMLQRLAGHLTGFQHIDLSIKKHGFKTDENPHGWDIKYLCYPESKLDDMEQYYIKGYALEGYQLRNKTAGGQGEGKSGIAEFKPAKGYYDGKKQGREDARKFVKHLFDLHLNAVCKKDGNKNQLKALEKFNDFLEGEKDDNTTTCEKDI